MLSLNNNVRQKEIIAIYHFFIGFLFVFQFVHYYNFRFLSFKTPLRGHILEKLPAEVDRNWGIADLIEAQPKLGLVVDLTNTTR